MLINRTVFLVLACFMILFVTSTTSVFVGVSMVGMTSSFLFISLFIYAAIFDRNTLFKNNIYLEVSLFFIFLIYCLLQVFNLGFSVVQSAFFFIVVPMLVSSVMKMQTVHSKQIIAYVLIIFYFLECSLAVYERIVGINVFPHKEVVDNIYVTVESWEFRSTGFWGHPLHNALCTSTLLGFILVSKIKVWIKLIALLFGLGAVFSFNARGAILVMSVVSFYYLFFVYRYYNQRIRLINLFFPLIIFLVFNGVSYLLFETSFGGRIFNEDEILDGSAQTRLDVLNAFDYIKGIDLWFGNPDLYLKITSKLGAAGIENFFVVIIVRYGLICGFSLVFILIAYFFSSIRIYGDNKKIILVLLFLTVGLMNNSLASSLPWLVFILSVHSFPFLGKKKICRNGNNCLKV